MSLHEWTPALGSGTVEPANERRPMAVSVNGSELQVVAATVADVVAACGHDVNARIATAVNGEFVPMAARATHPVYPGDAIEIVSPRQGG